MPDLLPRERIWVDLCQELGRRANMHPEAVMDLIKQQTGKEAVFLQASHTEDDKCRIETQLEFTDAFAFGMLFVDAARILARAYADADGATSIQPYIDRIKEGWEAEWEHLTTDVEFRKETEGGHSP